MTLTDKDLQAIKELTEVTLEEKLDVVLEEKLSHLPTKDEFFAKMDDVMGGLKEIREEKTVLAHQSSGHDKQIESLEKIHPSGKHSAI